ncbi:NTP binding protein [Aspergillus nomiae NRRL 13137]|uniref:NTP binding protein n=1 Tax=Aspergillus nomiae NRRL (strain ATCC 15546 / NRRL 13137 / CBS 260.88 / M93) TaxID=1509407 RepID=A0A0L1J017_ASPN3|nr:NTP binding protein [Aspergillus nomiae NRRL 13137]KNG85087.1 NTP binding protein [Aspergillus nomiae NRRL 13137]
MTQNIEPKHSVRDQDDEIDDDDLLKALENEDDSDYRARRIEQLNAELASAQNNRSMAPGPGQTTIIQDSLYPTLENDQILLNFTTDTHRCVIHFAHPDFARCDTMDEHMRALATRHYDVRFARVDVRDTPFVVEKLKIRVLPCVIGFKDGIAAERVVGFEGLALGGRDGTDSFSTATLEKRLLWKGVLVQAKISDDNDDSSISDAVDEVRTMANDELMEKGPSAAGEHGIAGTTTTTTTTTIGIEKGYLLLSNPYIHEILCHNMRGLLA